MTDGTKIATAILAVEMARQVEAHTPKPTGAASTPGNNLLGYFQRFVREIEKANPLHQG